MLLFLPLPLLALWAPILGPACLAQIQSQSATQFAEPPLPPRPPAIVDQYQASLAEHWASQQVHSYPLNFQDLLKQKRSGNKMEQCPCVVLPGSHKCVVYDGRYQATLLEEAMLSFVDNSMDPRIFEQRMGGAQISIWTLECHSEECRQCVGMLTLRLRQTGMLRDPLQYQFPVPLPHQLRPSACPRLRMSRTVPKYSPPPPLGSRDPFRDLISKATNIRAAMERLPLSLFGMRVREALAIERTAVNQPLISVLSNPQMLKRSLAPPPSLAMAPQRRRPPWERNSEIEREVQRSVRQARRGEPIIGERFVINCVERGEVETENTDFLNLCTTCWTWRQLPEDYFPRLINELVCKENDFCLSGWGVCQQRYRNFDVLQRVVVNGQEEWRPTTISAASCCDCKVKAGSQAHTLVVGGRS